MRSELHQFLPISEDATVSEAVDLATRFAAAKKDDQDYAGKPDVYRDIAKEAHVRASTVQRLVEPARRPKTVSTLVRNRLLTAYHDYLCGKLARIEAEIAWVESLARPDYRAVRSLAARARDLATRARHIADQIEALL